MKYFLAVLLLFNVKANAEKVKKEIPYTTSCTLSITRDLLKTIDFHVGDIRDSWKETKIDDLGFKGTCKAIAVSYTLAKMRCQLSGDKGWYETVFSSNDKYFDNPYATLALFVGSPQKESMLIATYKCIFVSK